MWISIPLTTAMRNVSATFSSTLGWISMPWMALAGLLFIALVVMDIGWIGYGVGKLVVARDVSPDLSRRRFLARVTGGTAAAIAGASVARGMIEARGTHEVVDVEVTL